MLAPNPPVVLVVEAPNPPPAVDAPKPPPPVDAPNAEAAGAVEPNGVSCANGLAAAGSGCAIAGVSPCVAAAAASAPNPEEPNVGAAAELPNPPALEVEAANVVGFYANAANPPPPPVPPPVVDEPKALVAGAADAPNADEPNTTPIVDVPKALLPVVPARIHCPNAGLAVDL